MKQVRVFLARLITALKHGANENCGPVGAKCGAPGCGSSPSPPEGVTDGSRGLSKATPPGKRAIPKAPRRGARSPPARLSGAGTPPGCARLIAPRSGGVAALDPRLPSGNPPGCGPGQGDEAGTETADWMVSSSRCWVHVWMSFASDQFSRRLKSQILHPPTRDVRVRIVVWHQARRGKECDVLLIRTQSINIMTTFPRTVDSRIASG